MEAIIAVLAIFGISVVNEMPEETRAFVDQVIAGVEQPDPLADCERVDMGGYFNYVDPTCAQ